MEADQQFVEDVIRAIVNNPSDVKTTRIIDERGVLISLDVNPADMGYVIGRQGQTARSVRTLLKIVGAKNNARVNLKINEPIGGKGPGHGPMGGGMGGSMGSSTMSQPMVNEPIDTSAVDNLNI
ncbi:MAG: KH domain-containing protein [Candidatus Magasanikbacteria bacterium]|nr:KH domain-containing protein [Candidatus Magasanikbacteria bacterium]